MKNIVIILLAVCMIALTAHTQVPQTISHQGYLTDNAGQPVNGTLPMTLRLFTTETGGTATLTQTFGSVQVSNGVYTLNLDVSSVSFNTQYWLEVEVNGEVQTPRTMLTSVPNSLQSQNLQGPGSQATGTDAVAGGRDNMATGNYSTIGGGSNNLAGDSAFTFANKGHYDLTTANVLNPVVYATVGGGYNNSATGDYATVSGGRMNKASGNYATVNGGSFNTASSSNSTVGGGLGNWASGSNSTIPGGYANSATGSFSFASGRRAKANHSGSFVWGDATDADFASTSTNQFLIRASGGVGIGTTSPQEKLDVAGTAQVTGFKMPTGASNGYLLTSDANGVGTWQAAVVGGNGTVTNVTANSPLSVTNGSTTPDISIADATITSKGVVQVGNGLAVTSGVISLETPVSITNGGTGSSTQNFVDLSTDQTIGGIKTFSSNISGNISGSSTNFTGSLSGDVTGTQSATSVDKIRGVVVATTTPSDGQVLKYNTSSTQWEPSTDNTGAGTDWSLTGNAGTTAGTNFVGTTTTQALDIRTNNVIRTRITTKGQIETYSTGQSVFIGEGAGASDDLTDNLNVFIGYRAGFSNTTGAANTANGASALLSNTTGDYNTANGYQSLKSNSTGVDNTAVGAIALLNNTTGSYNTANGASALKSNTTGSSNTAYGVAALDQNTIGNYNTASGRDALANNTTGSSNTANGYQALKSNTIGSNNTANGYGALTSNTTGHSNTASGIQALNLNTTGFYNSANGMYALLSNTTGGWNTASGYSALRNNSVGNTNTATGYEALKSNTTGGGNSATGGSALYSNTVGFYNTALGYQAGYNNSAGNGNVFLGFQAGYNETSSNKLYVANNNTNPPLIYGDFSAGTVSIGTNSPGASSLLELSSSTKGFVLPRMTKAQRDLIASPVEGMAIYQTDNTPGLRVYNGTNWMRYTETAD